MAAFKNRLNMLLPGAMAQQLGAAAGGAFNMLKFASFMCCKLYSDEDRVTQSAALGRRRGREGEGREG